ncbi:hypothetical protein AeMF1_018053 [Aphanomyces euteiches]|nr:hypothetical protein AeMF1_018053 [Aphanomyces euteiches]
MRAIETSEYVSKRMDCALASKSQGVCFEVTQDLVDADSANFPSNPVALHLHGSIRKVYTLQILYVQFFLLTNDQQTPRTRWCRGITQFYGTFYNNDTSALTNVIPRLPHLQYFNIEVEDTLDYVCPAIAHSTQITALKLVTRMNVELNESNVVDLVVWLSSHPVQTFSFDGSHEAYDIDIALRQKFYEAMVNCSTMDKLVLDASGANDLDFSKFTFSMRSLEVLYPHCDFIESLAERLEGSNVTDLTIFGYYVQETSAFIALLQVLPKTCIKSLTWFDVKLDRKSWRTLVPLLAECPVERLALDLTKMDSGIAQSIAMALEKNKFICELDLTGNSMAMEYFVPLIKSMTHPSRPVETKSIKWKQTNGLAKQLAKLKQLAEDRGGEFLF